MRIFDTHCHYNLPGLLEDWQTHWQNAQEKGVAATIVVGTNFYSSDEAVKIALTQPNLGAAIGIHPSEYIETALTAFKEAKRIHWAEEDALQDIHTDIEELRLILNTKAVVAIGETGLDYYRLDGYTDEEKQVIKKVQQLGLKAHLQLATEKNLPIILHVRDQQDEAYWDVLRILEEEHFNGKFILHCVSGPIAYVQKAIEMGGYISAAGNTTYKNAEHLRDLIRMTPADKLLLETDAPFLPPLEFRGKKSEPWMIQETAKFLENELSLNLEQCFSNSVQLFPTVFSSAKI
jgi:TatD DNase family protein